MAKPEEFSALRMYGNKNVFEKRVEEGYTEVAFGGGDWVGNQRIVRLWAFFHPKGKIATYEHPKFDDGSHIMRGNPFEAKYSQRKFQKHLREFQIKLGAKSELAEVVNNWEE